MSTDPAVERPRRPWGVIALTALFVVSAITVFAAPIHWLGFPAGMPGIAAEAPAYQRDIVATVAGLHDEGPSAQLPDVGRGDTGEPDDPYLRDDAPASTSPPIAPESADATTAPPAAAPTPDADAEPGAVFTSWVLATAGLPVRQQDPRHPNRATWRTATVAELADALRIDGAFTGDRTYMPQVGDVILFDGLFGRDARVIVGVMDQDITTAGFDGSGVSLETMGLRARAGVLGFGRTAVLEEHRTELNAAQAAGAAGAAEGAGEAPTTSVPQ